MRSGIVAVVLGLFGAATLACTEVPLPSGDGAGGAGATGAGGSGSTSTGGTGTEGAGGSGGDGAGGSGGAPVVVPDECVPSKLGAGEPLSPSCGVFVNADTGTVDGDGTQASPVTTIGAARQKAAGKPIYVCAATAAAAVSLKTQEALTIFGGLSCDDWTYSATSSLLQGVANQPAITLDGSGDPSNPVVGRLEDLTVTAADATSPGASSIAVFATTAKLQLSRCTLRSGAGAAGQAPAPPPPKADVTIAMAGGKGSTVATPPTVAAGGTNVCGAVTSVGGDGGLGGDGGVADAPGGDGDNGEGVPGAAGGTGASGTTVCANGTYGASVSSQYGTSGNGGPASAPVTATGLASRDGTAGGVGVPGKSGGGGGAGKSMSGASGGGGGGGGAGGCGGQPGVGGQAGGSSVALLTHDSVVQMSFMVLVVGAGAKGGAAGTGQQGQQGGPGGTPASGGMAVQKGCSGGGGGSGGNGGSGGGGAGGHAIGFGYTGGSVVGAPMNVDMGAAAAGQGGAGAYPGNKMGANGIQAEVQELL